MNRDLAELPEVHEPYEVAANRSFLRSLGVWHQVTRNRGNLGRVGKPVPATSCADAAYKRDRLGGIGIPLFDELKSHVGGYDHPEGRRYVVAHCRGTQKRDDEKLSKIVGYPVKRLSPDELDTRFGSAHGLVNPFSFARAPQENRVLQVFDETLRDRLAPPYTMMTNLGEATYGVEFYPQELIDALEGVLVRDIIADDASAQRPTFHTLGILTGNGPESGIELWKRINHRIRESRGQRFQGDVSYPHVLIESLPAMGLSMELQSRADDVRKTVLEGIERLCQGGATAVAIACNTTQHFSEEIREVCALYGAQFISLVDETAAWLEREGVTRFDLIGIGAVTDLQHWSDFRRIASRFAIHVPSQAHVLDISDLGFKVKRSPKHNGKDTTKLGSLISQGTQTDTVVIALTELSLVFAEHEKAIALRAPTKRFVDTLQVLADRMAEMYCSDWVEAERKPTA